jgi:mRNA interferase MazF
MQKRRPALVLNENTEQGDVILAFIGTQIPPQPSPASVTLESTDPEFRQTGLKTNSIIRLDKIATIERRLITRRLGKLGQSKLTAVDQALITALRISLPSP